VGFFCGGGSAEREGVWDAGDVAFVSEGFEGSEFVQGGGARVFVGVVICCSKLFGRPFSVFFLG